MRRLPRLAALALAALDVINIGSPRQFEAPQSGVLPPFRREFLIEAITWGYMSSTAYSEFDGLLGRIRHTTDERGLN